jgi:lipoate-protein ligase A
MKFRIIPHGREKASWHLALEEALFLKAKEKILKGEVPQPIIRMYSFQKPSVILGYMQNILEVDADLCKELKVDLTMRSTGGGSVYLGKEDLQYSLLLPTIYNKELLRKINLSISDSLQDVGFSPELKTNNNHTVIRMNNKSFVFDAERRFKNLLLHHGTTLVNNFDYGAQSDILKATQSEIEDMGNGMLWLKQIQEVKEKALVKALERNLPKDSSVQFKDFTSEEIKLAKELHKNFYANKKAFSAGSKKFGICYLPSTQYDMELYTKED